MNRQICEWANDISTCRSKFRHDLPNRVSINAVHLPFRYCVVRGLSGDDVIDHHLLKMRIERCVTIKTKTLNDTGGLSQMRLFLDRSSLNYEAIKRIHWNQTHVYILSA